MSMFKNLTIEGRLGRKPELKQPKQGGMPFYSFSMVNEDFVRGEKVSTWYEVNIRSASDNLMQKLDKGSHIIVSGKPNVELYNNKDGVPTIRQSVWADSFTLVYSGNEKNAMGGVQNMSAPAQAYQNPQQPAYNPNQPRPVNSYMQQVPTSGPYYQQPVVQNVARPIQQPVAQNVQRPVQQEAMRELGVGQGIVAVSDQYPTGSTDGGVQLPF